MKNRPLHTYPRAAASRICRLFLPSSVTSRLATRGGFSSNSLKDEPTRNAVHEASSSVDVESLPSVEKACIAPASKQETATPPAAEEVEYRCMAILKEPFRGRRGERCHNKFKLDINGYCSYHSHRTDPSWAKWRVPGPPPPYRPLPPVEQLQAEFQNKMKRKAEMTAEKLRRSDVLRREVQALLDAVDDKCAGATSSKLFDCIAADLLKAPSKIRVKDYKVLAEIVRHCFEAVHKAGLLEPTPDQPLVAIDLMVADSVVFYDALFRSPLVARLRATSSDVWKRFFTDKCRDAAPGYDDQGTLSGCGAHKKFSDWSFRTVCSMTLSCQCHCATSLPHYTRK
jgi:hypothetical protein